MNEHWSRLYTRVVSRLRGDVDFQRWLAESTAECPYDLQILRDRQELQRCLQMDLGWQPEELGCRVVDNADTVAETVGLMLGLRDRETGTLRFACPEDADDLLRHLLVAALPDGSDRFDVPQARRYQHALINLSVRLPTGFGGRGPLRGMYWASLLSGLSLYSGNLGLLEADEREHVLPNGRRFISLDAGTERNLGLYSLWYLPLTYPGRAEPDLVLGLFSPVPWAFGGELSAPFEVRPVDAPWVDWLLDQVICREHYDCLADQLQIGRHMVRGLSSRVLESVDQKLKRLRSELKIAGPLHLRRELPRATEGEIEVLCGALDQATQRSVRDFLQDEHFRVLSQVVDLYGGAGPGDVEGLPDEAPARIWDEIQRSFPTERARLHLGSALPPATDEPAEPRGEIEAIASRAAHAFVANALRHGVNDTGVVVSFHRGPGGWCVEVENDVLYTDAFLARYWIVRLGLIPELDREPTADGMGGLHIYLLRELARDMPVRIDFEVDLPRPRDERTAWRSSIYVPAREVP